MYKYHEVITIRQQVGRRDLTVSAATTEATAAAIAAEMVDREAHISQSQEIDGRQAWSVVLVNLGKTEQATLTEDSIAAKLVDGWTVEYRDADNDWCKVWLGVMRVVEG